MKTLLPAVAICLAALPSAAERVLTVEEFEALTTGKTFTFNRWSQPYGAEQYLPQRQVIWKFEGDDCYAGRWYGDQGMICFVYEVTPEPICWDVLEAEDGIRIRLVGDVRGNDLTVDTVSPEPLACPGPFLGS
jgi:hypothetical protein